MEELQVATVLTVYGIETDGKVHYMVGIKSSLQQYLPFTVLKLPYIYNNNIYKKRLQQYLPFTVLKLRNANCICSFAIFVATVLTVYGIETCHID